MLSNEFPFGKLGINPFEENQLESVHYVGAFYLGIGKNGKEKKIEIKVKNLNLLESL